jgi:hypothetical protein
MRSNVRRRTLRIALYALVVAALLFGCRGAVDRAYFDDEPDATGTDAQVEDRAIGSTADSSTEASDDDGGTDAGDAGDAADAADAAEAGVPHTVGGVVLGLVGTGMKLRLNGANDLAVNPLTAEQRRLHVRCRSPKAKTSSSRSRPNRPAAARPWRKRQDRSATSRR